MPDKRQRACKLRGSLLVRSEKTLDGLRERLLFNRFFSAWREVSWRSRRSLQRKINILSFRMARSFQVRSLLQDSMVIWTSWAKNKVSPRRKLRWKDEEEVRATPQAEEILGDRPSDTRAMPLPWPGTPPGLLLPPPGLPPPAPWQ
jgi:hypothetical protein